MDACDSGTPQFAVHNSSIPMGSGFDLQPVSLNDVVLLTVADNSVYDIASIAQVGFAGQKYADIAVTTSTTQHIPYF